MKHLLLAIMLLVGTASVNTNNDNYVYICTGGSAKCYHKTDKCRGIQKCGSEIKKITLDEAKKMNRRPCTYCYGKQN